MMLSLIKQAAKHVPTAEEIRKQRVSFIYGSVSRASNINRALIEEVLDKQAGKA